ncbi:hypothetical protein [[Clostridium] hylemonae]|uniref:hypothetical protein n=1 Tax=[Clostridium] hylemonae TaxID=89153 RepID=UPI001FCB6589|nr:hypothetical protein [[Clostridium] hylemonae]BDF04748.1 hypothetical protein CE91St63_18100 [[Clostridium] hylemonae]
MCTSIISNKKKTIIGWNLDILDMDHKVVAEDDKVYIAINDETEGWLPLFGANARGDFVAMPTCWPFDDRSNPVNEDCHNIITLDIDLLLGKKTLNEIKAIVEREPVYSVPGVTFQSQLSDKDGNVLRIIPGQGYQYFSKPEYAVLTNFSPFKGDTEQHPWMGWDRYNKAAEMLENKKDDLNVSDCFAILKATAQTVCPTVVSMVFDASDNMVYWCEDQEWDRVQKKKLLYLSTVYLS